MKVSYVEGLANHNGPESCGAAREGGVEALTGESTGRVFSRVRNSLRDADAVRRSGRPHPRRRWTHSLLRRAYQPRGAAHVSVPSRSALASHALAAQPKRPSALGPDAALDRPLVASRPHLSSLSPAPHGRYHLR